MYAEIVSIGTEILMGEITDTNSGYLASRLPGLGIELREVSIVGDNLDVLCDVLERAWRRSDLTLTTGGLGPTSDDLTREAIARVLGEEMAISARLLGGIKARFKSRGVPMAANNIKQAAIIPSALLQRNQGMVIATRTIKTFGLPEGSVNEMIALLFERSNPTLGIYARPDGIFLRAIARARSQT